VTVIEFLAGTQEWPIAQWIGANPYAFPLLDAAHILFQAFVVGSIAALDLRLLGCFMRERRVSELTARILPWTWWAFAGATLTGVALFIINAGKFVENRAFAVKLLLMALAGINMLVFHLWTYRSVSRWDLQLPPPAAARIAGTLSLVLWIGVVLFGRYVWFPWANKDGF
jgi:hypothetical protein